MLVEKTQTFTTNKTRKVASQLMILGLMGDPKSFNIPKVTNSRVTKDCDTDGPILYTRKKMRTRMAVEALASKNGKGYFASLDNQPPEEELEDKYIM